MNEGEGTHENDFDGNDSGTRVPQTYIISASE